MKKVIIAAILLLTSTAAMSGSSCSDFGESAALLSIGYANGIPESTMSATLLSGLSPQDKEIARAIVMLVYSQGLFDPKAARKIVEKTCRNGWR